MASAALVVVSTLTAGVAWASDNPQGFSRSSNNLTAQEQYFRSLSQPQSEELTARVVIAEGTKVSTLESSLDTTVGKILRKNNLSPEDFRTDKSKTVDPSMKLPAGSLTFLFKIEEEVSFEKVALPAPIEEVESSSVALGEKVVATEGVEGVALITTVVTRDISSSKKFNRKAKHRTEAPTTQSFTVLEAPEPQVVLVGTGTETLVSAYTGDKFIYPIANPYITSPFGMRVHPITNVLKLHDGTDFNADCGEPIFAVKSGTVTFASYYGAYGNRIAISHGDGLVTIYNHLSGYNVEVGDQVSLGDVIGAAGTTGLSTGCHLHFMVELNGIKTNPESYFE